MIGEFKVRMSSVEYGVDSFGPYGTIEEARAVCARLRMAINLLDDGVRRDVRISFGTRGRRTGGDMSDSWQRARRVGDGQLPSECLYPKPG